MASHSMIRPSDSGDAISSGIASAVAEIDRLTSQLYWSHRELGQIRATLIVTFGDRDGRSKLPVRVDPTQTTHDMLMAVLRQLAALAEGAQP